LGKVRASGSTSPVWSAELCEDVDVGEDGAAAVDDRMACSALLELSTDDVLESMELLRDPDAPVMSIGLVIEGCVPSTAET
jgi:hypothetical protein